MYKVILADDEAWVLKGLEERIDWAEYGFEIVYKTTRGSEALDKVKKLKPDILITDIKMPGLSGTELMQRIREEDSHVKFIVISGYSEFEYARTALQMGAVDYILKPIEEEHLRSALLKAKGLLEQEKGLKSKDPYHQFDFFKAMGYLRDDASEVLVEEVLGKLGFKNPAKNYVTLIADRELSGMLCSLGGDIRVSCFRQDRERFLLLANSNNSLINAEVLGRVAREGEPAFNVGISSVFNRITYAGEAYEQAMHAYYGFLIDGNRGVHIYRASDGYKTRFFIQELDALLNAGKYAETVRMIEQTPQYFKNHDLNVNDLSILYNHLTAKIAALQKDHGIEELDSPAFLNYMQIAEKFGSFQNVVIHLCSRIQRLFPEGDRGLYESEGSRKLVSKIKKYIDDNYLKEITLHDLALQFHINNSYLCQLLKAEIGQSFAKYVTERRIRYAHSLLVDTDLPIEHIANLCGYKDYTYFIKVFKKIMGETPSSYRSSRKENADGQ